MNILSPDLVWTENILIQDITLTQRQSTYLKQRKLTSERVYHITKRHSRIGHQPLNEVGRSGMFRNKNPWLVANHLSHDWSISDSRIEISNPLIYVRTCGGDLRTSFFPIRGTLGFYRHCRWLGLYVSQDGQGRLSGCMMTLGVRRWDDFATIK